MLYNQGFSKSPHGVASWEKVLAGRGAGLAVLTSLGGGPGGLAGCGATSTSNAAALRPTLDGRFCAPPEGPFGKLQRKSKLF